MKRIVVATNFSKEAENAIHYAAALASEYDFEIVLFHLKNMSIHAQNAQLSASSFENHLKLNQKELTDKANEIALKYKIEVVPYFAMGDFCEELKRCVAIKKVAFIVLGLTQKTFEQELLGNTTSKITHKLKFPTLSIPFNAKYKSFSNVLIADDMNEKSNLSSHKNIFNIMECSKSNVEVFHVSKKIEELNIAISDIMEVMKANIEDINIMHKEVISSEVIQAIKEEILLLSADLLIMFPHNYGFWNSLIHRSKTNVMISDIDIPLLAIPT